MAEYKAKILVVDDEEDITTFVGTLLEDNGYSVIKAADGKQGMAKAKSESPDLIILDISMPEESGVRMFRNLQELRTILSSSSRPAPRCIRLLVTLINHRTASSCWPRWLNLSGRNPSCNDLQLLLLRFTAGLPLVDAHVACPYRHQI